MCTLTLAWQVFDDAPVTVAANRDESLERAFVPPGVYREDPLVIAPQDAEAGGTWIGVNEHDVFAGLTNRWTDEELAGERSRGLLVADVLACDSAREAAAVVERTTAEYEYDGFHLVVADEDDAIWLGWDGSLERVALEPGVHVVVNVGFDDHVSIPSFRDEVGRQQAENAKKVRRALEPESGERAEEWLSRAKAVLGDHEYGVCIHENGYGTRSSSLITLGETLTYEFADGPPCRTTHEPIGLEGQV
ncbi:NRDE family protein [Natribaculum luteum]|uniref:NRDE family protein n=1 Tax=Natribaculum luteum TaxID=1586232 RepID=A0ABD5NVQ5_9EURY|nr:NRDE family protein [Natribaculum luteum]